ncbi:MAG: AAA family ATPase [Proteobacteria bacterium]|nr:AAA family ATPase [Pseudomonadota bacterium]
MNSAQETPFIETKEYRQFAEFCAICDSEKRIGICYGPPGVGKTLSAKKLAGWDSARDTTYYVNRYPTKTKVSTLTSILLYTAQVANSPAQVKQSIDKLRDRVRSIHIDDFDMTARPELDEIESKMAAIRAMQARRGLSTRAFKELQALTQSAYSLRRRLEAQRVKIVDPTSLIIVDEADRLKDTSLEQVRDIYDRGDIGLVLIGMPGIEKRLARYPQLYSRVGLVHRFRKISDEEMRLVLADTWQPGGIDLRNRGLSDPAILAEIYRITDGNFRTLHRLVAEIARLVDLNHLRRVTTELIEIARDGLVIGVD